ncbi:DUF2716 domain-containing protein [Peribacillus kribbensis]|uniref:DUF2716 domain-containing protein n=1 Tax=Peribacillus kribbensis TaxID=356658 RepID=UPI0009D64491|nr:DUF2716 domain-containing protein [Peribacillus kribbensis]
MLFQRQYNNPSAIELLFEGVTQFHLSNLEYKEVWDKIYEKLKFEPSISHFPSFELSSPFITYDVSMLLNGQ